MNIGRIDIEQWYCIEFRLLLIVVHQDFVRNRRHCDSECVAQQLFVLNCTLFCERMSSNNNAPVSVPRLTKQEIVDLRNKHLSPSLSLSYSSTIPNGLHIIRGDGQYLFDSCSGFKW